MRHPLDGVPGAQKWPDAKLQAAFFVAPDRPYAVGFNPVFQMVAIEKAAAGDFDARVLGFPDAAKVFGRPVAVEHGPHEHHKPEGAQQKIESEHDVEGIGDCFAASGMPLGFIDAGAMVAGKIEGDGNERDEKAEHDVKNVESEMVKTHGASIEAFGPQNLMQNAGVRQDSGLFLKVLKKTG